MGQFRLKKTRKKAFILSYIFAAIITIGAGTYFCINNILSTNADDEFAYGFDDDNFNFEVGTESHTEMEPNEYRWQNNGLGPGENAASAPDPEPEPVTPYNHVTADEHFAISYNATDAADCQNSIGCVSQIENQQNENLCWAYSYTTAIESTIKNQLFKNIELSAKHLDYQLSDNFSDTNNPYYDYIYGDSGSNRNIGDSANYQLASIVSTGKNTLVTEQSFWQKLQNADTSNSLSSFNSYASYLETNRSGYTERLESDIVLDESNAEYNLSSYETASNFIYYGEDAPQNVDSDYDRGAFIRHLKNAIMNYGAVGIGTHYNKTACGYTDANGNFTIIDKTTRTNKRSCYASGLSTAHAVTIVGWDDNWEYLNNGQSKKGAFLIQNSYGLQTKKEYLAYESAFVSFFVATGVEENHYDNVYDYTDYLGEYTKDSNLASGYQLVYNSPNNIAHADNELIFEFETKNGQTEKIEKISFSQRFKMAGAGYKISISTDNGENWQPINDLVYYYPGMGSISSHSTNGITVSGHFAIKVYSGIQCDETSANITICTNWQKNNAYDGANFLDSEKKYDLVNVYTSNVPIEPPAQHTISFATNNEDYVSLSKSSITVPDNTTISEDGNTLIFQNSDGEEIDRVEASLHIADDDHYTYYISFSRPEIINSDTTILAKFERVPRKFDVEFRYEYTNSTNETSSISYRLKQLDVGVMPVYSGPTPTMESEQEGISYVFAGWYPEIAEVTGNAIYTATFDTIYETYNITYELNGGQNSSINPTTYTAEHATPLASPTKEGYTFIGWYNNAEYTGNKITEIPQTSSGNITLYARWQDDSANSQENNSDNQNGSGQIAPPNSNDSSSDGNNDTVDSSNNDGRSRTQGNHVANTGYQQQTENNFIKADMFITAMVISTIGFVIYIIKNRRHLRAHT